MIDTFMLSSAFFIVGGGIGVIAGGLFAHYRVNNAQELLDEAHHMAKLDEQLIQRLLGSVQRLTNRNREYALAESKRQEQRRAAGEEGRRVQAEKRAAAEALKDTNHNSMRATLEMVG